MSTPFERSEEWTNEFEMFKALVAIPEGEPAGDGAQLAMDLGFRLAEKGYTLRQMAAQYELWGEVLKLDEVYLCGLIHGIYEGAAPEYQ
jgi:hypothetical protein